MQPDQLPPPSDRPAATAATAATAGPAVAARPKDLARARTPLVMLTTFLVELVIVAAVGNQFVVDRLSKQLHGPILKQGLLESVFTFYWRFSPPGSHGDVGHFWLSRVLCAVAVVVLGPVLVGLVVRGPVTFFRAFFSVVFAVVTATLLATFVRGLVADPRLYGFSDPRLGAAMFRPSGPDAPGFWGGLALGLVTGLIVAIVAVATRRAPAVADVPDARDGAGGGYEDQRPGDDYRFGGGSGERAGDAGRADGPPPWQDGYYGPPPPTGMPRTQQREPVQDAPTEQHQPVQDAPTQQREPVQDAPTQQWAPQQGQPQQGQPQQGPVPAEPPRERAGGPDDDRTQALRVPAGERARAGEDVPSITTVPGERDQRTARFPRPPDDEDLDPEH